MGTLQDQLLDEFSFWIAVIVACVGLIDFLIREEGRVRIRSHMKSAGDFARSVSTLGFARHHAARVAALISRIARRPELGVTLDEGVANSATEGDGDSRVRSSLAFLGFRGVVVLGVFPGIVSGVLLLQATDGFRLAFVGLATSLALLAYLSAWATFAILRWLASDGDSSSAVAVPHLAGALLLDWGLVIVAGTVASALAAAVVDVPGYRAEHVRAAERLDRATSEQAEQLLPFRQDVWTRETTLSEFVEEESAIRGLMTAEIESAGGPGVVEQRERLVNSEDEAARSFRAVRILVQQAVLAEERLVQKKDEATTGDFPAQGDGNGPEMPLLDDTGGGADDTHSLQLPSDSLIAEFAPPSGEQLHLARSRGSLIVLPPKRSYVYVKMPLLHTFVELLDRHNKRNCDRGRGLYGGRSQQESGSRRCIWVPDLEPGVTKIVDENYDLVLARLFPGALQTGSSGDLESVEIGVARLAAVSQACTSWGELYRILAAIEHIGVPSERGSRAGADWGHLYYWLRAAARECDLREAIHRLSDQERRSIRAYVAAVLSLDRLHVLEQRAQDVREARERAQHEVAQAETALHEKEEATDVAVSLAEGAKLRSEMRHARARRLLDQTQIIGWLTALWPSALFIVVMVAFVSAKSLRLLRPVEWLCLAFAESTRGTLSLFAAGLAVVAKLVQLGIQLYA